MSTRRLAKVPLFGNAAKAVTVEAGATVGAQIGVNLLGPDGQLVRWDQIANSAAEGGGSDSLNTTDDLEEGAWNLWFTDRRAQDAVGGILADTATIDLAYTAGTSITATLKDLADSGAGAALVKITRDAKGRLSGTSAATTTDLAEGTNLYFTNARADARITLQKAQPLGLATLDAGGKLDAGQLPALAITETFVVNTQTAMLALSAQEGDVAVRTDLSKSFILTAAPASTLANWQELLVPTAGVTSFNGRTGSVTPASGDYTPAQVGAEPAITAGTTAQYRRGDKTWQTLDKAAVGLSNVDNTSDANKPVSGPQASALALKQDISGLGTAAFASTGRATGNVPVYENFSTVGRGNPGLMLEAAAGTGRVGISGGLGETDVSGQAVFVFNAVGSASVTSSTEKRLGIFFFNVDGSTAGNRGAAFGINLKKDGAATIANAFGISNSGVVTPGADNVQTMGSAALRWSVVYAGTGTINTSDAREKTDVAPLTTDELAAAADLARAIGTYQWLESVQLKGADARHHAGLTVQQAIAIMQTHGLDPMRYGFICFDEWAEQLEQVDEETGEVTQAYRPAGDRYSFRHDELLLFIARGFAARLDALETAR